MYNVDPEANHDQCASIFNTAGIYMIIDVNSPQAAINRDDPGSSYTIDYVTRIFGVVEAFKGYPNTLAFFSANEVMNDVNSSQANPPYIRAVQRDLRQYISKQSSRPIPVGYSAADVRPILQDTWEYMQCNNNDDMSNSEFFGLNSYSWCGASSYTDAGYDQLVAIFKSSSIPVFFSEYGCNHIQPRVFDEVAAIYGSNMTSLSGGLVYEYSEEPDDFGLVNITGSGAINLQTGFDNLQSQYNKLNVKALESTSASQTSIKPPACVSSLISDSGFNTNFTIPTAPDGTSDLITNGISSPNQGKIVSVSGLTPSQDILSSGGKKLSLSIKPTNGANMPGGANSSGASSSSSSGSSGKKSAAPRLTVSSYSSVALSLLAVAGFMCIS